MLAQFDSNWREERNILIKAIIITLNFAARAKSDSTPPYLVQQYGQEPGIYFEKIGQLQQTEAAWKLAIGIDVTALNIRYRQLEGYLAETEDLCKTVLGEPRYMCQNVFKIIEKENTKLVQLIERLQVIYKNTNSKRGLINAIGTIGKTLFGIMDAEDARVIHEQMEMLQKQQQTLKHAAKNQLKVMNATIGHMIALEQALRFNEDLLTNVTQRMQQQVSKFIHREEVEEHLLVVTSIITDLIRDTEDITDYLTYTKKGVILTRLLPLEEIITELKEAATQLSKGLHFPFKIQLDQWNNIQKYISINAYYDIPNVYSIITFPIVSYPAYEIIRSTPFPVPNYANVFSFLEISHTLLAIDKENHNYLILNERELGECVKSDFTYVCERNFPIYFVKPDAPCEVQVYVKLPGFVNGCRKRHILSNVTLWIALTEPQTWLFSTPSKQTLAIQCNDLNEQKVEIERTGKLALSGNCRLTTSDIIIKTKRQMSSGQLQTHLADFNLTLTRDENVIDSGKSKTEIKLEPIIKDPSELMKLGLDLSEINKELDNDEGSIFSNKYVVYPVGTTATIVIISVITGIVFLKIRTSKRKNTPTIHVQQDPAMLY